jgi:hypothetical protein
MPALVAGRKHDVDGRERPALTANEGFGMLATTVAQN